ncbi:MAG TPA: hypothetical protein VM366_01425 [Anaerolineae bacterium]|nr:hypothetical protein [Anaerolineae bacterium]
MTKEDAFNAATFAFASYDGFFGAVAKAMGMEQALALQGQADEVMGAMQGKMIKEQAGVDQVDAQTAHALLENIIATLGMSSEVIEASPQKVVLDAGRCPIYEAGLAVGMEPAQIEAMCRAGPIKFMNAAAQQLNPDLSYSLQTFRSAPEEGCIEQIAFG